MLDRQAEHRAGNQTVQVKEIIEILPRAGPIAVGILAELGEPRIALSAGNVAKPGVATGAARRGEIGHLVEQSRLERAVA